MASATPDADSAAPLAHHHHLNPKTLLNQFLMRYTGKSIVKGDMEFHTKPNPEDIGYISTVRLPIIAWKENTADVPEFTAESLDNEKAAEQAAAQVVLDHYADWIAANPPPPKDPNKKNSKSNKRKDFEEDADAGPEKRSRDDTYDLNFREGSPRDNAASTKSLNNQPAWMTRGLGVNKEIFGESKGNLVKPGMYEEDLERIERSVREGQLNAGPDPFGDIFAERNGDRGAESHAASEGGANKSWRSRGPLPTQDEIYGSGARAEPAKKDETHGSSARPKPSKKEVKEVSGASFSAWDLL